MEEGSLTENVERKRVVRWVVLVEEMKKLSYIAMPMIVVTMSEFLLGIVSLAMVGHLGELQYSSAAIATSLAGVSGFSVLVGMSSALETLCGQAYGAEQYQKLGVFTNGAIICLILACLPISLLWVFMDKLLILIGQDPLISLEARKYSIWLIPSLFPFAIVQPLLRYLQTQSLILPMLFSSVATLCFHVPLCWVLVFKTNLGNTGAALAIGLSSWLNLILVGLYVKYSSACERTRLSFSKDVFLIIGKFFRLAVPSAVMICLQWWSIELVILLAGLLPNAKLETSVLSICLSTTLLNYSITFSLGAAASREKEVLVYVEEMTPFICLGFIMDGLRAILSGIVRGSGMQCIGVYINLVTCYVVAIPLAVVLGFVLHLKAKGLWIGAATGFTTQFFLFSLITSFTNWQKQATMARERIFGV